MLVVVEEEEEGDSGEEESELGKAGRPREINRSPILSSFCAKPVLGSNSRLIHWTLSLNLTYTS